MKTILFLMILTFSFGALASENRASDCTKTLHSEDRGNSKLDLDKQPDEKPETGGAVQG